MSLPTYTFPQPAATLVAEGVVTVLAIGRPAPARVVGQRVGLAASKSLALMDSLPGDCEGTTEGGWRYGYVGPYQVGYCYRSSDEGERGDTYICKADGAEPGIEFGPDARLPLGAIVGSATLVAGLPIVGSDDDGPDCTCVVRDGDRAWIDHEDELRLTDISDQVGYSEFTPGRWAWVFTDAEPTTRRCPWCGGGSRHHAFRGERYCAHPGCTDILGIDGTHGWPPCPVCGGAGHCEPIPWRGGPGFRRWEP